MRTAARSLEDAFTREDLWDELGAYDIDHVYPVVEHFFLNNLNYLLLSENLQSLVNASSLSISRKLNVQVLCITYMSYAIGCCYISKSMMFLL